MHLFLLANLIIYIVLAFALEKFMNMFFEKRRTSKRTMLLSYALIPVIFLVVDVLYLLDFSTANAFTPFVYHLPIVLIITLNYESSVIKRIVAILYAYVTLEAVTTVVANFIVRPIFTLSPLYHVSQYSVITLRIIANILFYFVAIILFKHFKFIKIKAIDFNAFWLLTIILVVIYYVSALHNQSTIPDIAFYTLMPSLLAGGIFLVFYLYNILSKNHEDKLEAALEKQEKDYYFTQCQLMQESTEKVKSIRHDMKMHLVALKDFAGDKEMTLDYLDSLVGDITASEINSQTGNMAIDSVINYKLKTAKEDNVKLEIKTLVPPDLNIRVVDIVTILGNLLDNALGAVERVEDKIIRIDISHDKGNLLIQIDNSFDGVVRYIEDKNIKEKRIATRKNGKKHGYGLENIRNALRKYDGHMDIAHKDNIFSVGILLYLDKQS